MHEHIFFKVADGDIREIRSKAVVLLISVPGRLPCCRLLKDFDAKIEDTAPSGLDPRHMASRSVPFVPTIKCRRLRKRDDFAERICWLGSGASHPMTSQGGPMVIGEIGAQGVAQRFRRRFLVLQSEGDRHRHQQQPDSKTHKRRWAVSVCVSKSVAKPKTSLLNPLPQPVP
jgi:hypothetical protein